MSTSIAIPTPKQSRRSSTNPTNVLTPTSSSYLNSPSTTSSYSSSSSPVTIDSRRYGKSKIQETSAQDNRMWDRRPSLLGSSLSKSEYTVVNLAGHSDAPPRLITCVKSSQGFDWNQELFLPSYMDFDSSDLERRPDPVHDITLTDEEAAALLP